MLIIMDMESGLRTSAMEAQSYIDEVLFAGWTSVPPVPMVDEMRTALRLAESAPDRAVSPSPFADPEFMARIYREQG